jgi:hypothetical protein
MNEENASVTGLSTDTSDASRPTSPQDLATRGSQPPVVSSAQTATTVHHEEEVTISSSSQPTPATETMGGRPDGTTADAGPAAVAPSAPTPSSSASLPQRPLTRNEAVVCILAISAWVILTAAGVAVPTKPSIDLISAANGKTTMLEFVRAWFLVVTCYTFTNIALLCCVSAVIGAIGRSARIDDVERNDPATDLRTLCISGMIRGFFMFIVVLSGTLILSDQKYDDITIEQYLKLAGLVSLLSFTIGYDPHLFVTFFERVSKWTDNVPSQKVRR